MDIRLRVVPSRTTAQQKGVRIVNGKPMFFKKTKLVNEGRVIATLLMPYRPVAPHEGPLEIGIEFTYPHLKGAPKRVRTLRIPKATRADLDNLAKETIDLLTKLGFIRDDAQIARLMLEKWHGPDDQVGMRIRIAPMGAEEGQ